MVDVNIGSSSPGRTIVGAVPASAGGRAGAAGDNVGAITLQHGLASVASAVQNQSCFQQLSGIYQPGDGNPVVELLQQLLAFCSKRMGTMNTHITAVTARGPAGSNSQAVQLASSSRGRRNARGRRQGSRGGKGESGAQERAEGKNELHFSKQRAWLTLDKLERNRDANQCQANFRRVYKHQNLRPLPWIRRCAPLAP